MNGPDKLSPSDFGALAEAAAARRKVKFDGTINLGHVLTFAAFVVGGFSAYNTLEKRLTLIEVKAQQLEQASQSQEARIGELLREIRSDLKDARRTIDEVSRAITYRSNSGSNRRSDAP